MKTRLRALLDFVHTVSLAVMRNLNFFLGRSLPVCHVNSRGAMLGVFH